MEYRQFPLSTVFAVEFLVNIAYYKLSANFRTQGEQHPFWEFVYVDRGSVMVTAGDKTYLLKAGEMVFHCPNEFHAIQALGNTDVIIVAFGCDSASMHKLEQQVLLLDRREKAHLKLLVDEAQSTYQYFENDPPKTNLSKKDPAPWGSDHMIKTYLEQLLIYICRREDSIQLSQRAVPTGKSQHSLILAQQAREYLENNFQQKITLDTLSNALGISVSQVKRIFREQIGTSMVSTLTALRISEAKRLIRRGQMTLTQIAEAVGYENIYYFSTRFKSHTGMSPSEYIKSVKD